MFRRLVLTIALFGFGVVYAAAEGTVLSSDTAGTSEAVDAIEGLTAAQVLEQGRSMFPKDKLTLTGKLSVYKERGFNESERPFELKLDWDGIDPQAECTLFQEALHGKQLQRALLKRKGAEQAEIRLFDEQNVESPVPPRYNSRIGESDITWMDLTLDYLWWRDAEFKPELDARVLGRRCVAIEARPPVAIIGCSGVRLWVDRKLGYLLQAEHLGPQTNVVRRMWVQKVKRFDDRWMLRDMRIITVGMKRETQLYIDDLQVNGQTLLEEKKEKP